MKSAHYFLLAATLGKFFLKVAYSAVLIRISEPFASLRAGYCNDLSSRIVAVEVSDTTTAE